MIEQRATPPFNTKEELRAYVLAYLREHPIAAFSTVSSEGKPQVATMYFYADDDFVFHLFSLKGSMKIKNLEANDHAGLAVGFGPERITVESGGRAEVVSMLDAKTFLGVIDSLHSEELEELPIVELSRFARNDSENFVLIRFTPDWLSFLNFDLEGHPESYYHDYQSVIP